MVVMDKQEFAKRLHSIVVPEGTSVKDINAMVFPLSEVLVQLTPQKLFRYRKYEENTVNAFKEGNIYALTADSFNDPYDTLVRFDQDEIETTVNSMLSSEGLRQLKVWLEQGNDFPASTKQMLPGLFDVLKEKILSIEDTRMYEARMEESRRWIISSIRTYFPLLAEMSKRFSKIACFSECIQSVLMWSHYADSHKGFALEYDFRPTLKTPIRNVGLFPVIYEDERYDVSAYIGWEYLRMMNMPALNPDMLSYIKIALHKSSMWAYEKEWRLIDPTPGNIYSREPSVYHYEPSAIYYGKHMPREEKSFLHGIAQEKGIQDYEMYIDYSSPLYEVKYLPYVHMS